MLSEAEIRALEGQVGTAVREDQKHHENLQNLLQQFQSLLQSYNGLKSDYEEEKANREKWKNLAKGQERNPFVLVLVDGDGYLFKEHLIKAGSDGGVTAAQLMSESIRRLLHERLPDQAGQCRVMVRIYCNLLALSKTLARAGLVGFEARSLSTFASNFTRSQDLFDFIDAGEKKEGADFKIREMFRLFADNSQCKHIFFAGCHDTGYLSLLTPYIAKRNRITLLKAASFHLDFKTLDLPIGEMPEVFMSAPLGERQPPASAPSPTTAFASAPRAPVCKHFQKGICKYGNSCTKDHTMPGQQLSRTQEGTPSQTLSTVRHYAKYLPSIDSTAEKLIPVNKDGDRIDTYCPMPSKAAWETYNRRIKQQKLCNKFNLGGECSDLSCEFDHSTSDVDPACLAVMRYMMRQRPCPRGPQCRSLKCYLGHMCQKEGCKCTKWSKFGRDTHTMDITVANWLAPVEHDDQSETTPSEANSGLKLIEFEKLPDSSGEGAEVSPTWNNDLL
ncbi:zinc finger CCCH domain-containing protein [Aspergillus novofumigatus IBT 16806]|uniref:C-x8-C-x5-C-x3-H type zinc finger protein n=1 Tax=Aspergillus novofumigatus (strain IBT 16806) TaxID=1392255 RepID=A0A2I1CHX6_ASPN1|nr:C-x8-C-x5-C-x3-H type zinc finger protein [Aspergillus novofumigatus IBT 16806]PKX97242.1 C-x8-C-x5-C-x3-H type zinc finger protein [Aspergillus novofumigatus IBT 16806]